MKECPICGLSFEAPPRQQTCSVVCGRKAMHARLKATRGKKRNCAHCGVEWIAMPKDRSKFCSWACHAADKGHRPSKNVECANCGNAFVALDSLSREGQGIYCSRSCHYEARTSRLHKSCESCGKEFEVEQCHSEARFCSHECSSDFLTAERSPSWKGGEFIVMRNGCVKDVMLYRAIPGRERKHHPKHRLVAGDVIGRLIEPEEIVIHLDRNKENNAPANLYIFSSRSEWVRVQVGADPWPERSNLNVYAMDNYARPDNAPAA